MEHYFTIKEHIGAQEYSWPESLVEFNLPEYVETNKMGLFYETQQIDYQVFESQGVFKIAFLTDLKPAQTKKFCLKESAPLKTTFISYESDGKIILSNGKLKVVIDNNPDKIFEIYGVVSDVKGTAEFSEVPVKKYISLDENGVLFAKATIECVFADESSYTLELKLVKNMEYISLDETIATKDKKMYVRWDNFCPKQRVTCGHLGKRKADAYCDENGKIPQFLVPHDVSQGFSNTTYASFYNENVGVGVFVADAERWNDGSYAVSANNTINAIKMYYKYSVNNDGVRFEYPLNTGSRMTALTMYDAEKEKDAKMGNYIREMQYYAYWLPLNTVKDWVLEWEEDKSQYPVFFDKSNFCEDVKYDFWNFESTGIPDPEETLQLIKADKCFKSPWRIGPVWTRTYYGWVAAFDMNATEMTKKQYEWTKSILVFSAYYCMQENIMPIKHMLAGHPNFLADYVGIIGMCAAIFKNHPMAEKWKEYYERTVALILKFHVRPDVKAWKATGGRTTENSALYSWGCLQHLLYAGEMLRKTYNDGVLLYDNFEKWANWFLNIATSPVDGMRTYIPAGAHAGGHNLNPFYPFYLLRVMGYELEKYNPLLSQNLYHVRPHDPLVGFETFEYRQVWEQMNDLSYDAGTRPDLKSEKFTGYGYVLRSCVNQPDEMCVIIQQIDAGQNYRWGRMGDGGCGLIHYYADNNMYSGNRVEDVGDDNMRDGEVGCTFAVLDEQQFRTIGQNELTNPLIDFDFVQFAKLDAGDYSRKNYRYRSIMMVDNSYIVIYDSVADATTYGRFTWFSFVDRPMPNIYQMKPGIEAREILPPQTTVEGKPWKNRCNLPSTRGVAYDGLGDFLTIVSHKTISSENTDFGAVVNGTDYIFNDDSVIDFKGEFSFNGNVGFARKTADGFKMAIIRGYSISYGDICVKKNDPDSAISLIFDGERYYGKVCGNKDRIFVSIGGNELVLYENGTKADANDISIEDGYFEYTAGLPRPDKVSGIRYIENIDGICVLWNCDKTANSYEIELSNDGGATWVKQAQTAENRYTFMPDKTKVHIRIRAVSDIFGEWSCDYPIIRTNTVPSKVDGLKVFFKEDNTFEIRWGSQLGVCEYRLYRYTNKSDAVLIYSGCDVNYVDRVKEGDVYNYYVIAVNGFGEGEKSSTRDTAKEGLAFYDPAPNEKHIRDTIRNEHGYTGFDFSRDINRKILKYPE